MSDTLSFEDRLNADNKAMMDARAEAAKAEAEVLQVDPGGVVEEPQVEAALESAAEPEPDRPDKTETVSSNEDDEPSHEERTRKAYIRARQAERRAKELEAQLAAASGQRQETRDETIQREAQQMARQIAAHEVAVQQQRRIREAADRDYKDFGQVLSGYADTFPDWGGVPQTLIDAATEAAEGSEHRVLYHLGKNLDEAERIMALPPARMGAAIAKLAAKLTAPTPPKQVSQAPRPVQEVTTAAVPAPKDPAKMSIGEWIEYEDRRQAERRQRLWGR